MLKFAADDVEWRWAEVDAFMSAFLLVLHVFATKFRIFAALYHTFMPESTIQKIPGNARHCTKSYSTLAVE